MITVYGREGCVGCRYTTRFLSDNKIFYVYIDVDNTTDALPSGMPTQLPYLTTPQGNWSGYKRDRLKALAIATKKDSV